MQSPSSEQPDPVPDVVHTAAGDSLVIDSANESDGAELHIVEREPWFKHLSARIAIRVAIALLGVIIGVLIGGHTTANVGPMQVRADLSFGAGGATINIPPIGALSVDAYKGPLNLNMTVLQVDEAKATQFIQSGANINALTAQVTSDVRSAIIWLLVKSILWAIVSAAVLSLLVFRRYRAMFLAGGLSVVMVVATIVVGYATFSSSKLQEPRYSGILAQAPALVGNVENLAAKFGDYRKSLLKMVQNVSKLYTAVSTLPGDPGVTDAIRVLHVSDIHLNPAGYDLTASLAKQYNVNFIIDTGDIVDWGSPAEAPQLDQIATYGVPYVYVRGNHDSMAIQAKVASEKNAVVLDDTSRKIDGLTIAGTGDPRFSPDRETLNGEPLDKALPAQAKKFLAMIKTMDPKPDILLMHDPIAASVLDGTAPLMLAGHKHQRSVTELKKGTLLMVEGSTGGAGLRGLESEKPTPLEASVLYFDKKTHKLQAYDEITVGGLGLTEVNIVRKVAPKAAAAAEKSASEASESSSSSSSSADSPGGGQSGGASTSAGAPVPTGSAGPTS